MKFDRLHSGIAMPAAGVPSGIIEAVNREPCNRAIDRSGMSMAWPRRATESRVLLVYLAIAAVT